MSPTRREPARPQNADRDARRPSELDSRLTEALEHIDGAFVILDRDWRFTFVNRNAVDPIGISPSEVIGRNMLEMFPAFIGTATAKHYQSAMESRQSSRFEECSPVNGRWYEVSVYPFPDGVAAHWHDVTTRKLAQLALAESEERARMTAESALTGLFDWEPQTGRMYWSDQSFRALGYAPGEIMPSYSAWASRVHPDDLPTAEQLLRDAQAARAAYYGVHRLVWPDGSIHMMEARAQFSYDASGACVRMRGTYVDITERAVAEQKLRESEERFRAMADDAPLPIWVTDADGSVQFINRKYRQFYGLGDGAAAAVDWAALIHPEDRAYVTAFAESVRTRQPFHAEARARRWDGAWRWIESHGAPRWTADGIFLGFVGTSPDVTEQRLVRESERAAAIQAHFRSLFESLPGPYVVLTPDNFRTVAVSDAYLAATNTSRSELIDKPVFEAFANESSSAEGLDSLRASLERVVAERRVDVIAVHRLAVRRTDGSGEAEERWWSPVSAPVLAPDGRVSFIIHRAEDVTSCMTTLGELSADAADVTGRHKNAEIVLRAQELQRTNECLRLEVETRARIEEQRAALLRQLVDAQEAERGRVARELHDGLGQHLTALQLAVEAMQLDAAPSETRERLKEIVQTLNVEVDRIAMALRPAALDDLGLEDALHRHVRMWEIESGVATDIHIRGLHDRVAPALETTVYRLVQEALTNVRKHARADRASVIVERRDGMLVTIIEDNGVGFDGASGAQNRGLGFSTMRERAALAGGELQVESSPSAGTTVYFKVAIDG